MLYHIEEADEARGGRIYVAQWVSYEEAVERGYPSAPCGSEVYYKALIANIRANRVQHCGRCYQDSEYKGVPVFSDGTSWDESMKNWGVTMADAWDREGWYHDDTGKAYHCHRCTDWCKSGDWDTLSGPIPPKKRYPPADLSVRLSFDVLYGCQILPEPSMPLLLMEGLGENEEK